MIVFIQEKDFYPVLLSMDSPIEDIATKFASNEIFNVVEEAEEKVDRAKIKHILKELWRDRRNVEF